MFRVSPISCALALALALCPPLSAQNWEPIDVASDVSPAPRIHPAAVYDPQAHTMVLFGGRADNGDRNDVWSFDIAGAVWSEIAAGGETAPGPRFTHNAVYDSGAHRMLIWSGRHVGSDGSFFLNDVWAFDLAMHTWSELVAPDPKPLDRYGTAAIYDPRAHALVNFAGFTSSGRFDDTWRFDLASSSWTDISPASGPLERCLHSGSYDAVGHRMIIYGGQSGGRALDDIWALDLQTNEWRELSPDDRPEGRIFTSHVYDRRNHRVIIFGGNKERDGVEAFSDETWAFDLASQTWAAMETAVTPAARQAAASVYVESEDRLLLFGGSGGGDKFGDLWSLSMLSGDRVTAVAQEPATPSVTPFGSQLLQNHPNPFNAQTVLPYELARRGDVGIDIYNPVGQLTRRLTAVSQAAGPQVARWDGTDADGKPVAAGVYVYRLLVDGEPVSARSMLLLK